MTISQLLQDFQNIYTRALSSPILERESIRIEKHVEAFFVGKVAFGVLLVHITT